MVTRQKEYYLQMLKGMERGEEAFPPKFVACVGEKRRERRGSAEGSLSNWPEVKSHDCIALASYFHNAFYRPPASVLMQRTSMHQLLASEAEVNGILLGGQDSSSDQLRLGPETPPEQAAVLARHDKFFFPDGNLAIEVS